MDRGAKRARVAGNNGAGRWAEADVIAIGSEEEKEEEEVVVVGTSSSSEDIEDAATVDVTRVPFQLTRVEGIPEGENVGATGIRDALQEVGWTRGFLGNFMVDLPWLVSEVPRVVEAEQVVLAHGGRERCNLDGADAVAGLELIDMASSLPPFGSHHCKFAVLFGEASVRVVIHTANYIPRDWGRKTQGAYVRDFPRLLRGTPPRAEGFGVDLEAFLVAAYGAHPGARQLAGHLRAYDFSEARAALVASLPGKHPRGSSVYGHRRLGALMRGRTDALGARAEAVANCSSLGSLDPAWLDGELTASLLGRRSSSSTTKLKLVWPTRADVEGSLEGEAAGDSIPLRESHCKPFLVADHMHRWTAPAHLVRTLSSCAPAPPARQRAMPHFKSYAVVERDATDSTGRSDVLHAFLLTSANVSKAAWGWVLRGTGDLKILSHELGVLFLPDHHLPRRVTFRPGPMGAGMDRDDDAGAGAGADDARVVVSFPVPYSLRPAKYRPGVDMPWFHPDPARH